MPNKLTIQFIRLLYLLAKTGIKRKYKTNPRPMTDEEIELAIKQCRDNGIEIKL